MEQFLQQLDNIHDNQVQENNIVTGGWSELWNKFCIIFSSMPWVVNSVAEQQEMIDKLWNINVQFIVNYFISPIYNSTNYKDIAREYWSIAKIDVAYANIRTGMLGLINNPPTVIPLDLFDAILLAEFNGTVPPRTLTNDNETPDLLTNYASAIVTGEKLRIPNDIFGVIIMKVMTPITVADFDAISYMDTYVNVIFGSLPLSSLEYVKQLKSNYVVAMLTCITGINSYEVGYFNNGTLKPIMDALLSNISGVTARYENYIATIKKNGIIGEDPLMKMELNRRESYH